MLHGNVCSTQLYYSASSQPINAWLLSLFLISWYMSGSGTVQHTDNKPWEQQTAVCASAATVLVRCYYSVPSNLWLGVGRCEIPTWWHHRGLYKAPNPHHPAVNNSKRLPGGGECPRVGGFGRTQKIHGFKSASLSFTEKRKRCWSVYRKATEMLIGTNFVNMQP